MTRATTVDYRLLFAGDVEIAVGVQPHGGHEAGHERVTDRKGLLQGDCHGLSLQIAEEADRALGEQLDAAHVASGQDDDRGPRLDQPQLTRDERHDDVELTRPDRALFEAVVHVGEAFRLQEQEFGGNVLRRDAGAADSDQPQSRRLGRRLGRRVSGM